MQAIAKICRYGPGFYIAAAIVVIFSFWASAHEPAQTEESLFGETMITNRIEKIPDTSNLSPEELARLYAGKDLLTEFFRRLNSVDDKPAVELLSDSYRANYTSSHQFYREHFNSERIVSYQLFDFILYPTQKHIRFRIFLTETLEGTDIITQHTVELGKSREVWKILELR